MELGRFFGFLHPALVHFPLVLLLVSFALEAIGYFGRRERYAWAAQITLICGAVGTLFAFVCGNFAEIWAARDGVPQAPMELHELYATITSWLFVGLAAVRLLLANRQDQRWKSVYLAIMACACVLLVITGHKGAMLVYQHGAGVQARTASALPTHEDLAVLRQRQDPEALFYSNKMHHVFGAMVLVFAGLLLTDQLSPKIGGRLRKITPALLIAGGIFLMIWSDTDSWPLSHQRPVTDKEVLMHKTYAVLMLAFGFGGLRRRKGISAAGPAITADSMAVADLVSPQDRQGRMMAVFSLVGGALLFTHVHSNAPYANVAVGVYIHHTVMGCIALSIGIVKLGQDLLTARSSRGLIRALAWSYPCLMLAESIFLLNYNEGLPWFLGYGKLSLAAPHGGLIAPLGDQRAELVYHPETNRIDLYLLKQGADSPYVVDASEVQAITRVGTESTIVPLRLCAEPGSASHFAGQASYLKGLSTFQTQVIVKDNGKARRVLKADFEPWIDSASNAPRSQAAYVCPMHPSVGAGAPGTCAVCGMTLVPNKGARPADILHDNSFRMDLAISDAANGRHLLSRCDPPAAEGAAIQTPSPGQKVRLQFTPRCADGSVVSALDVVHTKKLHLIIVSRDLSIFDHVHPEPQPDGSLVLDYVFSEPGEYVLYADCTPSGDRNQVFPLSVTVSGKPRDPLPLEPTPAQAKTFDQYRVQLDLSPEPAQVRDETQLSFTVSSNGVPVTDLEPYLGAGGHCVALSEDTRAYLHSHPIEVQGTRFGPTVTFHTVFPKPGLYKIWGQFLHHGKPLIADFVVRVP